MSGAASTLRRRKKAERPGQLSFLKKLSRQWQLMVMLLPVVVYLLVFKYYPMYGAQIAFKDFRFSLGIEGSPWVGFKHFANFFSDYRFWRLIRNTLTLSTYSLVVNFVMSITLALMLHCVRNERFKKVTQTVTYMPHFISVVVMCSLVIRFFNPYLGILSRLIQALGGTNADLMGSASAFPHIYVWSGVWQNAGWGTIIYMATLSGVDYEQHEAAIIDGATRLKRVWHIDIPALIPTATIMLIMNCGRILNVGMQKVLLLQNDLNKIASETISTYVYAKSLAAERPAYSFSTAIGLFESLVSFVLIVGVNQIAKGLKQNSLW